MNQLKRRQMQEAYNLIETPFESLCRSIEPVLRRILNIYQWWLATACSWGHSSNCFEPIYIGDGCSICGLDLQMKPWYVWWRVWSIWGICLCACHLTQLFRSQIEIKEWCGGIKKVVLTTEQVLCRILRSGQLWNRKLISNLRDTVEQCRILCGDACKVEKCGIGSNLHRHAACSIGCTWIVLSSTSNGDMCEDWACWWCWECCWS